MAITFVAAGTSDFASGTGSASPGIPVGYAADDIFILHLEGEGEDANADSQGDFGGTLIGTVASAEDGASQRTRHTLYWKRATASESSPTITNSGDHTLAVISAWRGCKTSGTPINASQSSSSATSDTSVSITGTTTTVDGCMVVASTTMGDNNSFSGWTNSNLVSITEAFDVNTSTGSDGAIGCAYGILTSAGATGATTATASTSEEEANFCIALEPEGAGGGSSNATRLIGGGLVR